MPLRDFSRIRYWLLAAAWAILLLGVSLSVAWAATPGDVGQGQGVAGSPPPPAHPILSRLRPAYHLAERSEAAKAAAAAPELSPAQANEHPLMPVLRWAYSGLGNIEKIHDYSATLVKRERIGGKLLDREYMFVKLRQKPFSVYMCFLAPAELRGREVIYVKGENNGNIWRTAWAWSAPSAPFR